MKTVKHFWDLEETCMTSWSDGCLANVSKLRDWVEENNVTEVTVFSFAVWNDADVEKFNREFKPMIERAFNVKVVDVVKAETVKEVCCYEMRAAFSLSEFVSLWGKKRSFMEYCALTLKDCTAVLVDDCVPNMTVHFHDSNLVVEYVDVTKDMRNVYEV
jgi:hypothetical protein